MRRVFDSSYQLSILIKIQKHPNKIKEEKGPHKPLAGTHLVLLLFVVLFISYNYTYGSFHIESQRIC